MFSVPVKVSGRTPMMVKGAPFNLIALPTTEASRSKRLRQ
jgi:hypothetical protein